MSISDTTEIIKLFPEYAGSIQPILAIGTVISVAVAVCTLFWGYKLLKFWVSLAGFAVGFVLGAAVGIVLQGEMPVIIGVVLAAGVIFACLAFFFYKVGIFLFVGVMGYGLVTTLLNGWSETENAWWIMVLAVAAGILAEALAVKFIRMMVILSTSVNGGATLAFTICPMIGIDSYAVTLITAGVLVFMGLLWQFHTTYSEKRYTADDI